MSLLRVLVVGDRPDVRHSFMFMLNASGYSVAEAADGDAALDVLARNRVAVLITDLHMHGRDGLALIGLVRRMPPPQPYIIGVSGSGEFALNTSSTVPGELGADVILRKPIKREQLLRVISEMGQRPPIQRSRVER